MKTSILWDKCNIQKFILFLFLFLFFYTYIRKYIDPVLVVWYLLVVSTLDGCALYSCRRESEGNHQFPVHEEEFPCKPNSTLLMIWKGECHTQISYPERILHLAIPAMQKTERWKIIMCWVPNIGISWIGCWICNIIHPAEIIKHNYSVIFRILLYKFKVD